MDIQSIRVLMYGHDDRDDDVQSSNGQGLYGTIAMYGYQYRVLGTVPGTGHWVLYRVPVPGAGNGYSM